MRLKCKYETNQKGRTKSFGIIKHRQLLSIYSRSMNELKSVNGG
jgi:hypothetical protein